MLLESKRERERERDWVREREGGLENQREGETGKNAMRIRCTWRTAWDDWSGGQAQVHCRWDRTGSLKLEAGGCCSEVCLCVCVCVCVCICVCVYMWDKDVPAGIRFHACCVCCGCCGDGEHMLSRLDEGWVDDTVKCTQSLFVHLFGLLLRLVQVI